MHGQGFKTASSLTVSELFREAGLQPTGPVLWGEPVSERRPGVYVVSIVPGSSDRIGNSNVDNLEEVELAKWVQGQPVIYIGCTTRPLKDRLKKFYRHQYGKKSPHRGGQAIKLLTFKLWVFWAPIENPIEAERVMIGAFCKRVGRLPFANRRH